MKQYKVTYWENATRFSNFEDIVLADTEREAVEDVLLSLFRSKLLPTEDGSIKIATIT